MTNGYFSTLELHRENMAFSAGHTAFFSATEREPLHGHRYTVSLAVTLWIEKNGMAVDYRFYKHKIIALCAQLDQTFLMPGLSPYLTQEEDDTYYYFIFNHKKIPFLKEDVTILPVSNITVEELSKWFITQLVQAKQELDDYGVEQLVVKIFSAPGQSASHTWARSQCE